MTEMPVAPPASPVGPVAPPASLVGGGGERQTEGEPAANQLESRLTSGAVARGNGEGGIGLTTSCIRASATSATVRDGLLGAGATRLAYVTSDIGAPPTGGSE